MTVGKAIYYLLTNSTDVTDIVSTRVYPEIAEQNAALPYVVYNISNNEPTDTKPEPSKLDTAQIEVNVYSESYTECIDLSVAVRAALDRVKGTYNGVNVQSIQYLNEIIDFDEPQRAYNIAADYDVRISRTDFEIAQGSPITGVELGELSDVNVTGVTDNQVLSYDAATDTWVPAIDAGGASELSDLSDVSISLPSDGEVLIYSGGEFVNDNIAISSVTGLQSELDGIPDSIFDLNDVGQSGGSIAANSTLKYIDGQWTNSAPEAPTPVYDELSDLTDTTITTPTDNQFLRYNGTKWVNETVVQYHGRFDSEAETLLDGATATVELYYTAQADGDGLHEDAQSDTPTSGYDIQRKLYYAEKAQADPDTSGDWTQFTAIADNTTFANAKAALLAYLKERTGGTVPISLKMTWEEVAQAPSFTGLLNESYGSGAEAAYSTRRLNGNYSGDCMTIRRASDGTTQSIGFVDEEIDESAIETFCSGTTCTVQVWRDQSGNGNDAEQTDSTKQPTIYTGGAIVKGNGRAALNYDGIESLSATFTSAFSQPNSISAVGLAEDLEIRGTLSDGYTNRNLVNFANASGVFQIYAGSALTGSDIRGERREVFAIFNGSNSTAHVDGVQDISGNAGADTLGTRIDLGAGGGTVTPTNSLHGFMQEWILWNSDKSTDRTSIESNIGDYFTQNTPLLDTYSGAAAAYSLRLLDSSYVGSAVEVYNGSSYADIGFNVFGELDTVALAAHCGSNDGFVSKWYDQSGNSNDAAQATTSNMPKIYDGTTGVVTENGKPAVEFDGSNDGLTLSSLTYSNDLSLISLYNQTSGTRGRIWCDDITGQQGYWILFGEESGGDSQKIYINDGAGFDNWTHQTAPINQQNLLNIFFTSSQIVDSLNGTAQTQSVTGFSPPINLSGSSAGFAIGNSGNMTYATAMKGQEFILYNSDQSSNRTNIEDNINTFYNIY